MTNKSDNPKKKTFEHASHWYDIFDSEFRKESDRASVIIAAAMFDDALNGLLKNHLVSNASSTDDLFDGANAPLSTFSSKISMAHRLGLISSKFCRDLHLIRKIRNEFAHNVHGCSFEDSRVKSRTLELYKDTHKSMRDNSRKNKRYPEGTRGDFMLVCSWMLFAMNASLEHCEQLNERKVEFGYKEIKPEE